MVSEEDTDSKSREGREGEEQLAKAGTGTGLAAIVPLLPLLVQKVLGKTCDQGADEAYLSAGRNDKYRYLG